MEADSSRHRAGAVSATTPSENGAAKKSSSSVSLAVPGSSNQDGGTFPNPITRTQSACFPVTKTPSSRGLAMIKTTEKTPPPTNMSFEEALALLHKLEKQLTVEVQNDIQIMRFRMTSSKIELVARKSLRLYQMRVLLNQTRRLCREEEDVMGDFSSVKSVIDSSPRGQIDEDDYMATKTKLLTLGGRLTDIRRKQQKLAAQVEELQGAMRELVDMSQLAEMENYEFSMESFKKESSALPEMPRLTTSLPSYDLFNSAPYSTRDSRPSSAMSVDSDRPRSAASIHERHRTVKVSVAVDSTDEEDAGSEAYYPQRNGARKKKDLTMTTRRRNAPSETSDTDGEDCFQVFQNNRMTPLEAKQKAEEDRKKAAEEEAQLQKQIDEQLKREEQEERQRQEEIARKKKEDDEKAKAVMEAKQKAAAEKAAELQAKRKADEDKKAAEAEAKRKEEQAKKKAIADAKREKEEEAKRKKEEAEAAKKAELEAKKKEKEELKRKQEEEQLAKKQAEEEARKSKELAEEKRKSELAKAAKVMEEQERQKIAEEETAAQRKRMEDERLQQQQMDEECAARPSSGHKKSRTSSGARNDPNSATFEDDLQEPLASIRPKSRTASRNAQVDESVDHTSTAFTKSRTSSNERKISSGSKKSATQNDEDLLYDDSNQIATKEDLFAAISDTSLKSGKKARQRRQLASEHEYEDSDEDIPSKRQLYKSRTASRERPQQTMSSMQVDDEQKQLAKSRTSSRERPKGQGTANLEDSQRKSSSRPASGERLKSQAEPFEGPRQTDSRNATQLLTGQQQAKSRTASRERPKNSSFEADQDDMEVEEYLQPSQKGKSRTSSREGRRSREEVERHTAEVSEDIYASSRPKSRGSRAASGDLLDFPNQGRGLQGSRPPSRFSDMMSENLDPELQWDEDEEMDDENMPSLAELSAIGRTGSRERPASKASQRSRPGSRGVPAEKDSLALSIPRPGSRTLAQEEELLRLASEQEARGAKSRTSSRDRLRSHQDSLSAEESSQRGAKSRTSSRDRLKQGSSYETQNLDEEFEEEELALSLRGLRERPQAIYDEEFEREEELKSKPRGAKSRTQSRERPPTMGLSPKSSFGEADIRGAKSRTASRERPMSAQNLGVEESRSRAGSRDGRRPAEAPMWPEESSDSEVAGPRRAQTRSRTSSTDRKKLVGGGREDLLAEDLGYDTLPSGPSPSGFRSYRDEIELDTQQYAQQYESGTMDSGVPESYHSACDRFEDEDDEPPPAEPIYGGGYRERDGAGAGYKGQDGAGARPKFPRYSEPDYATARDEFEHVPADNIGHLDDRYQYDEEQYASEIDHEDDRDALAKSNKKVSFAESDQKIILKPDPDIKSIPGTKLFGFAPSSTHEQPPEGQELGAGQYNAGLEDNLRQGSAAKVAEDQPVSGSPKSFLKAMTKGMKGQPKAREERGGSLIDNIFRRGRSTSAQGSRSSSRQSSLDRAEKGKPGGSSRSDYSAGSADNDEMSETESVSSFFKKKKPKKVNTVDFDELFARGHAMSAQIEQNVQPYNGFGLHPDVAGPTIHPNQNELSSTPFEIYSKDEAFKKSQKAAGIGYAEKVQSYLTDQQSTKGLPFSSLEQEGQAQALDNVDAPQRFRKTSTQQETALSQSNYQPLQATQLSKPPGYGPESAPSSMSAPQSISGYRQGNVSPLPASVSPTPSRMRAKKQMTPQEFLSKIQEFVQKAEIDTAPGYSQPVWPAIIQSPEDATTSNVALGHSSSPRLQSRKTSNEEYEYAYAAQLSPGRKLSQKQDDSFFNQRPEEQQPASRKSSQGQGGFIKNFSLSPPKSTASEEASIMHRKNSYSTAGDALTLQSWSHNDSLAFPTETPQRLAPPGYGPKPRDHSPFRPPEPSVFTAALERPLGRNQEDSYDFNNERPISPDYRKSLQAKVAPSPGKSYLDKPSLSPDPFGNRVEMDAPPSANDAAAATSSILSRLRQQANQNRQQHDDVSGYLSVSDYSSQNVPIPSPRRGRSPVIPLSAIPADRHIPNQLKPDPLTGHENSFRQPQVLQPAYTDDYIPSIQETDLYRKLQAGIDKLMQSERFRELAARSEARLNADPSLYSDPSSYSQHLGRAEFGVLKKKTGSMQAIGNPMMGGERGSSYQPRDLSNERPASAMAKIGGGGRRSTYSSHQPSRDSSLGRHDSRHEQVLPDTTRKKEGYQFFPLSE